MMNIRDLKDAAYRLLGELDSPEEATLTDCANSALYAAQEVPELEITIDDYEAVGAMLYVILHTGLDNARTRW